MTRNPPPPPWGRSISAAKAADASADLAGAAPPTAAFAAVADTAPSADQYAPPTIATPASHHAGRTWIEIIRQRAATLLSIVAQHGHANVIGQFHRLDQMSEEDWLSPEGSGREFE